MTRSSYLFFLLLKVFGGDSYKIMVEDVGKKMTRSDQRRKEGRNEGKEK